MTFYYDNQTRSQADSLMEQQHYPVLEEAASEDDSCQVCGADTYYNHGRGWICPACQNEDNEEDDEA